MKRLAALAAALCLLTSTAHAKGVVLIQTTKYEITTNVSSNAITVPVSQTLYDVTTRYTLGWLDRLGARGNYDIIRTTSRTRSIDIASGLINGVQYDWGIMIGRAFSISSANNIVTACYPCSMTVSKSAETWADGYQPKIPWLVVEVPAQEGGFSTTTQCSLGVSQNTGSNDPGHQFAGYGGGRIWVPSGDYAWPMNQAGSVHSTVASAGDTTSGSLGAQLGLRTIDPDSRIIVGAHASNWSQYPFADTPPAWRDSLYSDSWFQQAFAKLLGSWDGEHPFMSPDSANVTSWGVYVWDDPGTRWGTQDGVDGSRTKTLTYVHWLAPGVIHAFAGASNSDDEQTRISGVPEVIGLGVVHLDSLTGGRVLGRSTIRLAAGVTDLVSEGGTFSGGGGQWSSDSVSMQASLDSLRSLGIPIVGTVDTDSLTLLSWGVSQVKNFVRRGFRLAVQRDADNTATLTAQRAALTPYGRVDRVLWGKKSDFTAAQLGVCSPLLADSVAYAIRYAGFTGIAMNAEEDSTISSSDTPWWPTSQRVAPASNGQWLMVLAYPGYNHRGAAMGNGRDGMQRYNWTGDAQASRWAPNDSTFCSHYMHRTILGAITNRWMDPDQRRAVFGQRDSSGTLVSLVRSALIPAANWTWHGEPELSGTVSPKANVDTGTNLIRVSMSSLGSGQWGSASPNMPGFYQLKYTVAWANAMNRLAGRTVVSFVYPEDLTPRDIQR